MESLVSLGTLNSALIGFAAGIAGAAFQMWRTGRDQRRSRQLHIFSELMTTRHQILGNRHVDAFNGVQVAFYGKREIIDRYDEVIAHLAVRHLSEEAWRIEYDKLFAALLGTMASALGFRFSKKDIESFRNPQFHQDIEAAQVRQLFGMANAVRDGVLTIRVVEDDKIVPAQTNEPPQS